MYFKRGIDIALEEWTKSSYRKPLLIRGARQVGKTASIRNLGKSFDGFVEVNFEENKAVHAIFDGNLSPERIIEELSVVYNASIKSGKTLLFFDEIQSCIGAIQSLRFFYEKMPELHVIAAGSLLEFALEELPSFGVGRIQSLFMYPFSFVEFITNIPEDKLLSKLREANPNNPLPKVIHDKLMHYLKRYIVLGGMPEVVAIYLLSGDIVQCRKVLDDLILTFRDDFKKYKKHISSSILLDVFLSVVQQNGGKFIFSKASETTHRIIKEALQLLQSAGLVIPVVHSNARGIPLGAEVNPKKQKMLLFDTGIFLRLLNLDISDVLLAKHFELINKGGVAELFVGLEMVKSMPTVIHNQLYYWHRESPGSNAEIDYIIQKGQHIIPIEVKSSGSGAMQSMHMFLKSRELDKGIRISTEQFSHYDKIDVYPLYGIQNIFS